MADSSELSCVRTGAVGAFRRAYAALGIPFEVLRPGIPNAGRMPHIPELSPLTTSLAPVDVARLYNSAALRPEALARAGTNEIPA